MRALIIRAEPPFDTERTKIMYDLQKASLWKRASAYLFDIILLGIVAVGIALVLSTVLGYDAQINKMQKTYDSYAEQYGININISLEDYEKLSDEQKAAYEEADKALAKDAEFARTYSLIINMTLIIITFGVLIAYLLLEFLVPLLFKNGQTLGKKAFGVAVMRVDGVKLSPLQLLIRTVLGKFTIETMFPIFLVMMIFIGSLGVVGTAVIVMLLILQVAVIALSKTNSAIHDLIAGTVTVDMASQMIFGSAEELMEHKKRVHAEKAERAEY